MSNGFQKMVGIPAEMETQQIIQSDNINANSKSAKHQNKKINTFFDKF